MSKKKQLIGCYFIHDRLGLKPFKVCQYSNNTISIFANQLMSNWFDCHDIISEQYYQKIDPDFFRKTDKETKSWLLWHSFEYEEIWISDAMKPGSNYKGQKDKLANGHTILIKYPIADHFSYVYIESEIIEFRSDNRIIDLRRIPNAIKDIPSDYAVTETSFIKFNAFDKPDSGKIIFDVFHKSLTRRVVELRQTNTDIAEIKNRNFDVQRDNFRKEGTGISNIHILFPNLRETRNSWLNYILPFVRKLYPTIEDIANRCEVDFNINL